MRLSPKRLLLIFVILAGCAFAQRQPPDSLQPFIQEIDKVATEAVKSPESASFTIGIVGKSGLLWSKSYGYADVSKHQSPNADTVYRVGSITKQFTALMLLQLVHDGKVHFSDPVEKYFPEIHLVQGSLPFAQPITLLQLATHTGGLDREPGDTDTYVKGPVVEWEKTLIAALPHTKYIFEPGTHFSYSNIGYAILGAALSRAAHQSYTEYVKQKILIPLGMTHSDFEATASIRQNLAIGYLLEKGKLDPTVPEQEHSGRGYKVPNGALYTTVGDLARFEVFEMLNGPDTVLSKDELKQNYARVVIANSGLNSGYGIGFAADRVGDRVFLGHSGGVAGYVAAAYFEPATQVGIVILHNALDGKTLNRLTQLFYHRLDAQNPQSTGASSH
jgi:CubicO group peptidase (beta-lactamase class C family)